MNNNGEGNHLKIIRTAAQWLFILCIPVLLLSASIRIASTSAALYRYGFDKYDISRVTGLSTGELNKAVSGLISYFNSSEEYIDITVEKDGKSFTLFNERETEHLKDVKALFKLDYRLMTGTLIYVIVYAGVNLFLWQDTRQLWWGFAGGSTLTLALLISMGMMVAIDFKWFFYQFHVISFANDLWLLDPYTDYLIMLFPEGFWFDTVVFCAVITVSLALILGGVGWWGLKTDNKTEEAKAVS